MGAFDHINVLVENNYIDTSAGVKAPDLRDWEATSNQRQNTHRGARTSTSRKQIDTALNQPRKLRSKGTKELLELDQSGKIPTLQESPSSRQQRGEHF